MNTRGCMLHCMNKRTLVTGSMYVHNGAIKLSITHDQIMQNDHAKELTMTENISKNMP